MLPKPSRLNLKKDFKRVATGKKLESKFLTLFLKTEENQIPKIGIATSTKNFKKAHERNRARRLTSFAFETLYSKLPTNISIVALPKAPILNVKSQDVVLDLQEKLKNNNLLIAER